MKIEHFAINVEKPIEMADWYKDNLGMEIVKKDENHPYTAFLRDSEGRVMLEIYNNPTEEVPDYRHMNPLIVHLAFVSEEPGEDSNKLVEAGAIIVSDDQLADGSHLVMLRDPWGFSIQLCKRGSPMLKKKNS